MNTEEWKPIVGFGNKYEISSFGNVASIERRVSNHTGFINKPRRMLKQKTDCKGYSRVFLDQGGKTRFISVHRLVAIAFIPNDNNKPQVNHINGNKKDNRVENLEWCTNSENQKHAWANGLQKVSGKAGKPKRRVVQIDKDGNEIARFDSIADATKAIGYISKSNIGACCRGQKKSVGGFFWEYERG